MRAPILMYHKIAPRPGASLVPFHYVPPGRFDRHLAALARFGFETVSLSRLTGALHAPDAPSRRLVAVTFDDGYQNFYENALPRLQKRSMTATVFVVAGLMGGTNAWDSARGDVSERLMDAGTVRDIHRQGIEIGSHSTTHARLTKVGLEAAREQIVESRRILGDLLAESIDHFCYPYGAHDEGIRRAVQDAGYRTACSVEKGWNDSTTDPYRLKRVNVRSDTSTPILFWKLWRQNRAG